MNFIEEQKIRDRKIYGAIISLVALYCGSEALAQVGSVKTAVGSTNTVAVTGSSTNVTELGNITVIGKLDQARNNILPNLGATAYTHTADQIDLQSQGD